MNSNIKSRILIGVIVIVVLIQCVSLVSASSTFTSTGFKYPTGTREPYAYAGWLAGGPGMPSYFNGLYHIGQDIQANVGDDVYPISDGEIIYISVNGWDKNKGDNNYGLVVKHRLNTGEYFLALYGHVRPIDGKLRYSTPGPVTPAVPVSTETAFAKIGPYGSSPHLHFGILPGTKYPSINWGRMPLSEWPSTNGFVDPINWITTKTPNVASKPAEILTQSISPTSVSAKGKLTFIFSIKNPNSDSIKNVRLGAQIRTNSPQGPWIDDPANDKVVTLSKGTKNYDREFTVPQSASSGYYDARWVILDDKTGTWIDSETMTRIFEVKTQSQPPVLDTISDKSVSEKEKLTFRISAKDPDGDKVTYSAEGLPSGAKLTSSGLFTWTPGSGTAGKYTVKFIATANGQIDSKTIKITVNNPSSALPEITSITPTKTAAGTFDLTIRGKNFNSKTAVEMVYFDGRYVGQGTIKSRSSTRIVVTEKMTGALPGVYVVKVRNNPSDPATESNGKELTITTVPVTLSISPASGKQGTTFSFTGNGYTPNRKIEWHVKKPDGTEFPVGILTASSSGTLSYTYKSNSGSMIGTYTIWAVDKTTGRVSNQVKEKIT